ncbi:hypothetical protein V2J09_014797 [Rumex salicifolius]
MRSGRPRRENFSHHVREDDWTFKPLDESSSVLNHSIPNADDDHRPETEQSQPSSSSSSHEFGHLLTSRISTQKPSNRRRHKRGTKNRIEYVPKPELSSKSELSSPGSEVVESPEVQGVEKLEGNGVDEERIDGCETSEGVDDVLGMFADLQLDDNKVELSEEHMNANDQLQEDELLVIESIYGENVYVLDKWKGLRSFQVHVHVEITKELEVSAIFNDFSNPKPGDGSSSEDKSYFFKVQYLPPIVLTCLLPRSYPSHCPPSFNISVQWLDSVKISSLCTLLDALWSEQPGQEILYQWVDWLHASSLSHLGFDKRIVLGPYGVKNVSDRRAISRSISPDTDIPTLKSYNEERRHETFLADVHECCICFSEYAGTDFIRLPCHHFFCTKCMGTYADIHIKEGTVNKLQCPNEKCNGMVPPGLLKRLLGVEAFERWEALMLQKTLDSMSDVAYCPRCETACIEDEEQHAQCPKCFFSFCTLCREKRHVGIACMTPEMKLRVLEERQDSSQLGDEQKKREQEMINELLSVKEILRDAKQCPSCKMAISRTEGCNKMVCNNCGSYFCYRCNQAIDGYDHFWNGGCELFPNEEIQRWEERMNARQMMAQIHVQLFAYHGGRPCPSCRQVNVKAKLKFPIILLFSFWIHVLLCSFHVCWLVGNNNHIFCWACQTHYCYLCRQVVRRSSQHYGPKGCKQHSAEL